METIWADALVESAERREKQNTQSKMRLESELWSQILKYTFLDASAIFSLREILFATWSSEAPQERFTRNLDLFPNVYPKSFEIIQLNVFMLKEGVLFHFN